MVRIVQESVFSRENLRALVTIASDALIPEPGRMSFLTVQDTKTNAMMTNAKLRYGILLSILIQSPDLAGP